MQLHNPTIHEVERMYSTHPSLSILHKKKLPNGSIKIVALDETAIISHGTSETRTFIFDPKTKRLTRDEIIIKCHRTNNYEAYTRSRKTNWQWQVKRTMSRYGVINN